MLGDAELMDRFGGGSELLRDGDANNVWKVLDEGMACVSHSWFSMSAL